MRTNSLRPLLALLAILFVSLVRAGTITVTSPANGDYLGLSNTLTFNISGASVRTRVTVTATSPTNTVTTYTTDVTPDTAGGASGSIPINFNAGAAEGQYTLSVTATESGNAYNTVTRTVTVDVTAPKFTTLTPVSGGYTRGVIKIRATVQEANLDTWTIQVNGQTIATGDSNPISADYDATGLQNDGVQSIIITVTDKARNSATQNSLQTLDRQKPTVQIVFPTESTKISNGADVNVVVDVSDASTSSVDRTGIDVIAKKPDGTYLARVTFVSLRGTSGTTQRWTGRIRYKKGQLPSAFLLSVSAIDRAGNAAALQQINVRYGR